MTEYSLKRAARRCLPLCEPNSNFIPYALVRYMARQLL